MAAPTKIPGIATQGNNFATARSVAPATLEQLEFQAAKIPHTAGMHSHGAPSHSAGQKVQRVDATLLDNPIANAADTSVNIANGAELAVSMGLGGTAAVASFIAPKVKNAGFQTATSTITKARDSYLGTKELHEAGIKSNSTKVNDALFIGVSAMGVYGVAKSYAQQLNSLKHMYADVTGVDVKKVSTFKLLTGPVPASLKESRDKLVSEHLVRGGIQAIGLAFMVKAARGNITGAKHMAMMMGPQLASMGADILMGETVMPVYANIKNAYNSGQPLTPDVYADFVFAASKELQKHGQVVGKKVAHAMAQEYAAEHTDPGVILREVENGKFMERVSGLIAKTEAEQAQLKAQQAEAKAQDAQAQKAAHVDKLNGHAAQTHQPIVGEHTKRLAQQASSQTISIA